MAKKSKTNSFELQKRWYVGSARCIEEGIWTRKTAEEAIEEARVCAVQTGKPQYVTCVMFKVEKEQPPTTVKMVISKEERHVSV